MFKKIKLIACSLAMLAAVLFSGCAAEWQDNWPAEENMVIYIKIGEESAAIRLALSDAARELKDRLAEGDIVYTADDYGGFEKVGELGFSLPRTDTHISVVPGDVVLYLGNNIAMYYGRNAWSFTPLGRIEGLSQAELESFLQAGGGPVRITLSLSR